MNLKENWYRIKADSSRRNPITNTLQYAIQIISFIAIIALIPKVIWSIGLLNEPERTILDVYGKGFIPAWLAALFTSIGNYYKNRFGKTIAFSSLWRKEERLRNTTAIQWFEAALNTTKDEKHREVWLKEIYASYICFLLKQGYLDEAKTKYHDALEYISQTGLRKEIENDYSLNSYLDDYDKLITDAKSTYNTQSPSK
jgi:hypothetical protein